MGNHKRAIYTEMSCYLVQYIIYLVIIMIINLYSSGL